MVHPVEFDKFREGRMERWTRPANRIFPSEENAYNREMYIDVYRLFYRRRSVILKKKNK